MTLGSRAVVWMLAGALTGAGAVGAEETDHAFRGLELLGGSRLGITLEEVAADAVAPRGARVASVEEESPAEVAGLREGDVIVEFDGEAVRSVRQLARLVRETPADRRVEIGVVREGKREMLTAELEARPRFGLLRELRNPVPGFDWRGLADLGGDSAPHIRLGPDAWRMAPGPGRPRLGIRYQELGDQLAEYFGAGEGGVLVVHVDRDSPADRAGLKAGDVVTRVGERAVEGGDDLRAAVREAADGATLQVTVSRRGTSRELDIVLEGRERPASRAGAI
jgi:serine protease Do